MVMSYFKIWLILSYSYTSLDNMQYIGFKLNDKEYTIPILKVREIIKSPALTRLPLVPDYVEGVTNLKGRVYAVSI